MNVYRVGKLGQSRIVEAGTVGDALAIYRQETLQEPQDVILLSDAPVLRDPDVRAFKPDVVYQRPTS